MVHRRSLRGIGMGLLDRFSPSLAGAARRRQLWKQFKFSPEKQILLDASGKLRPLDKILASLATALYQDGEIKLFPRSTIIEPDRSLSINLAIARRLGRLSPVLVIEEEQPFNSAFPKARNYHLAINHSLTFPQVRDDKTNFAQLNYGQVASLALDHPIEQLGYDVADALRNFITPQTLSERRMRQGLEQWHRGMQHLIDGTAGLDAITTLAVETEAFYDSLVVAPGARNIHALSDAEAERSSMLGNPLKVRYPSTPSITLEPGGDGGLGAVHFHPQVVTTGIIALKLPIVMISTEHYTLIEMTAPESVLPQYVGRPLSDLVDHPLLNRLDLVIEAIDTSPPLAPVEPGPLEQQVLKVIGDHYLFGFDHQPMLEQWFRLPVPMPGGNRPMVMIHHRAAPVTTISQEEAMRFQLS